MKFSFKYLIICLIVATSSIIVNEWNYLLSYFILSGGMGFMAGRLDRLRKEGKTK